MNKIVPKNGFKLFGDSGRKLLPKPKVKYDKTIPQENKFNVIAKYYPELKDQVYSINWDGKNYTIEMSITENNSFDTYKWFDKLNPKNDPNFLEQDKDNIIVTFTNQEDIIAKIKFSGLSLIAHKCNIHSGIKKLTHNITISYTDMEFLEIPEKEVEDIVFDCNEIADEEWSKVSLTLKSNK